jgi:hypothetical protein
MKLRKPKPVPIAVDYFFDESLTSHEKLKRWRQAMADYPIPPHKDPTHWSVFYLRLQTWLHRKPQISEDALRMIDIAVLNYRTQQENDKAIKQEDLAGLDTTSKEIFAMVSDQLDASILHASYENGREYLKMMRVVKESVRREAENPPEEVPVNPSWETRSYSHFHSQSQDIIDNCDLLDAIEITIKYGYAQAEIFVQELNISAFEAYKIMDTLSDLGITWEMNELSPRGIRVETLEAAHEKVAEYTRSQAMDHGPGSGSVS